MKRLALATLAVLAAAPVAAQYVTQPYPPVNAWGNAWGGYAVVQPAPQQIIIQHAPRYTTLPRPWYNPLAEHPLAYQERLQAVDVYNAQVRQEQHRQALRDLERSLAEQEQRNRRR